MKSLTQFALNKSYERVGKLDDTWERPFAVIKIYSDLGHHLVTTIHRHTQKIYLAVSAMTCCNSLNYYRQTDPEHIKPACLLNKLVEN